MNTFVGGNTDSKGDPIWKIAQRNNLEPKKVTVRRVKKYRRVGLL